MLNEALQLVSTNKTEVFETCEGTRRFRRVFEKEGVGRQTVHLYADGGRLGALRDLFFEGRVGGDLRCRPGLCRGRLKSQGPDLLQGSAQ